MDIRHAWRIKIIQELFSTSFSIPKKFDGNQLDKKTKKIIKSQKTINQYIKKYLLKFPVEKIAKIDLAILQLAIYELIFEKKEPIKVIINEAVQLAKEFGGERSYSFVNAILGKVCEEMSSSHKKNYEK